MSEIGGAILDFQTFQTQETGFQTEQILKHVLQSKSDWQILQDKKKQPSVIDYFSV